MAFRPRVSSLRPLAGDALALASVASLDAVAPPLPDAVAEIGCLSQWALAHAGKVSVKWNRQSASGDPVQAMMQACRAGGLPDPEIVGTYDEARAWLARLHGQPSRVWNFETKAMQDGPPIDGLSLRFLPFPGRRLVGLDFDGVIDANGCFHPVFMELCDELGTFVELSVSGKGAHAYVWADVPDDAPNQSVAFGLGDGGADFVPWDGKAPSVAIYCGRAWRHFRWTGDGFAFWYRTAIAERTQLIGSWLVDIARGRAAEDARKRADRGVSVPPGAGRRRIGGSGGSWSTDLTASQVAHLLGGSMARGRLEAQCPRCAETGRISSSGRPSLVVSDGPGSVRVTCWYCREHGDHRDVWRAVGDAVARYRAVAS